MTVLSAFGGQVKPGRFDDVVQMGGAAAKIVERHGAKNIRAFTAALGVEQYGGIVMTMNYESSEAFGACYDELMADEEIIRLMSDARGENTPWLSQSSVLATEIPLGSAASDATGNVVLVGVSQLVPGKMKEAVAEATAAHEYYLSHGAVNHRFWVYTVAGTQSMRFLGGAEFDSIRAYGKLADSFYSDPEAKRFLKVGRSPDAPTTSVSVNVYTRIPL